MSEEQALTETFMHNRGVPSNGCITSSVRAILLLSLRRVNVPVHNHSDQILVPIK
jgi:hypothetical protein